MSSVFSGLGRGTIKTRTLIPLPPVSTTISRTMAESAGSSEPNRTHRSTLNQEEVDKFRRMAHNWWESNPGLISMNRLRVPFIRDGLINSKKVGKLLPQFHT